MYFAIGLACIGLGFIVFLGHELWKWWSTRTTKALAGSLIPEIYIVPENFEEIIARNYSERRNNR